jgi:hypothetical protein
VGFSRNSLFEALFQEESLSIRLVNLFFAQSEGIDKPSAADIEHFLKNPELCILEVEITAGSCKSEPMLRVNLNVANICYNRTAGDAEKRLGAEPFEGVPSTFANRTGLHLG